MKRKVTHIVGVDEVGRGPLAGPVAVGVVCVPLGFDWSQVPGVRDSKLLSEKVRRDISTGVQPLIQRGALQASVTFVAPQIIDRIGIVPSIRRAILRGFQKISMDPETVAVKLDGLLTAPAHYRNQETIVKGDQKEQVIGLASILAKVARDQYMVRIALRYPHYGFEHHKGYGTPLHRSAIAELGLTEIHRTSYCRNLSV